ncbi:MAG TPA: lysophospholipid acyltransferase family protein [Casimicrobiaceae bacterium]|nr:lysophospholipid acyltransferase family protein [Casimicrobiaceae bacterium]
MASSGLRLLAVATSAARSLAFALFQLVVTPPYAIAVLSLAWLPPVPRFRFITYWCRVNLWAARVICGIRHEVVGLENMPSTPHIIMAKHSSTWETLFLTQLFPPLAYVAKKELLAIPFFGWAFRFASPITIDRRRGQDAMSQIVDQGRERFRQGFWIVIYPEGTRIRAGRRAKFKTGGARLAVAMGTPVLPVAHNAGWLWPKGVLGKKAGTVTLSIGAPIASAGKDPVALAQEVERWVEGEVERLGNPLLRARRRGRHHGAIA